MGQKQEPISDKILHNSQIGNRWGPRTTRPDGIRLDGGEDGEYNSLGFVEIS